MEDDNKNTNPVKELLEFSYFCEDTFVSKTRTKKCCSLCEETIPVGSAHIGAKLFSDEYYQVNFCNDCKDRYSVELTAMRNKEYDTN